MASQKRKSKSRSRRNRANKRTTVIAITAIAVLFVAAVAYGIYTSVISAGTETYTDGGQTVKLLPNGKFTAELYHGDSYSGTYSKVESGGWTNVHLNYDGDTAIGMIMEKQFFLPDAWQDDDGHGHGTVLSKIEG